MKLIEEIMKCIQMVENIKNGDNYYLHFTLHYRGSHN